MSEDTILEVAKSYQGKAYLDNDAYLKLYEESIRDPEGFWGRQADRLDWSRKWDRVLDWDYHKAYIRWFEGAKLNVSANCLDRHLEKRGDQVAIIWESDDPGEDRKLTYRQLHTEVCKFANVLKAQGVNKGDRVCIYMPMVPEAAVAMLACTRIGAIHSVVFGGFSPEALKDRINDSECCVLITADQSIRGGKKVPLKTNADKACESTPSIQKMIVVQRGGAPVEWQEGRDVWYHEAMASASADCPAEAMDAEDPLFILYTSGSTGKPKGVLHTTAGYLLYTAITRARERFVFWGNEEQWRLAVETRKTRRTALGDILDAMFVPKA